MSFEIERVPEDKLPAVAEPEMRLLPLTLCYVPAGIVAGIIRPFDIAMKGRRGLIQTSGYHTTFVVLGSDGLPAYEDHTIQEDTKLWGRVDIHPCGDVACKYLEMHGVLSAFNSMEGGLAVDSSDRHIVAEGMIMQGLRAMRDAQPQQDAFHPINRNRLALVSGALLRGHKIYNLALRQALEVSAAALPSYPPEALEATGPLAIKPPGD